MTKKELDEKLGVIDREINKIFEQFPILIDAKARNKVETLEYQRFKIIMKYLKTYDL